MVGYVLDSKRDRFITNYGVSPFIPGPKLRVAALTGVYCPVIQLYAKSLEQRQQGAKILCIEHCIYNASSSVHQWFMQAIGARGTSCTSSSRFVPRKGLCIRFSLLLLAPR